jgi:hypothetical protein
VGTGAVHVERSGVLRVRLPAVRAFAFFTPEGERAWVPGWEPEYLHPPFPSTSPGPGTVFRTRHDGQENLWVVTAFDESGAIDYARLTAGSRVGSVHVRLRAAGDDACDVEITYRLTSLSLDGDRLLAAMSADAFEAMLRQWEATIDEATRKG